VGDDFETSISYGALVNIAISFNALYVGDDFETGCARRNKSYTATLSMPFMWVMILKHGIGDFRYERFISFQCPLCG